MVLVVFLITFGLLYAHDLQHEIQKEGRCIVVSFFFPDGNRFSYEEYEVYKEGSNTPFQVGRTDALGRVAFCPNERGVWWVKTVSADGHGTKVRVYFEEEGVEEKREGFFERYKRLFAGLGWLLGIFALLEIYLRRFRK